MTGVIDLYWNLKKNNKSYHATLHIRTYACVISLFPNSFNSRPLHSEKKNDSSYPSYEYVRYMRIMCTLGMYVVRKVCITLTFEMYVCFFELSFQRERESRLDDRSFLLVSCSSIRGVQLYNVFVMKLQVSC